MAAGPRRTPAVVVAKILLPMIALGILATLVLLSRSAPQGEPLRFVDEEIQELAASERLGRPRYAAVTEEGTQVTIVAETFTTVPDRPRVTEGDRLEARLETPDGTVWDIRAKSGEIDENTGLSLLQREVEIDATGGYIFRTDAVRLRTDRTYMESLAPVVAVGPEGRLEAARMEVFTTPGQEVRTRAVFTGGVRVVYRP